MELSKYGIKFPVGEAQFGRSVHFTDLQVYLDENNVIHYSSYTKPTDSKRYLHPLSFHPRSIFKSIPFSQMLRTLRNNSVEETRTRELDLVSKNFESSGYNPTELNELKLKAIQKFLSDGSITPSQSEYIVFPVHFFEGVMDFKKLVNGLSQEFNHLIGETRIIFAMKKGSSLGNTIVRNKGLSLENNMAGGQSCKARNCLQCPLVLEQNRVTVNGNSLRIPNHLNCKTKNAIYMWVCNLCGEKEVYFGRTTQEVHDRTSGHRGCFSEEKWEKSALSMHAREVHGTNFSLNTFSIAVVKKVSPQQLRREEFKTIDKFRTLSLGLNRYKT